jgi:hypothetical protein
MDAMNAVGDVEAPVQASDNELELAAAAPVEQLLTRRAKRLSKRARWRQDESSNAVESPDYFAVLNKQLNTAEGGATWLTWFLRIIGVEQFVMHYVFMTATDVIGSTVTAQSALWAIFMSSFAIAELVSCTVLLDSMRRVIRPGEHLHTMRAGRFKLSARAMRRLRRLRLGLRVPQAFFVAVGSFWVAVTMIDNFTDANQDLFYTVLRVATFAVWGLWFALVVPLLLEWWLTLSVASALAADATIEVVITAETIAPTETDWMERVAEPAKRLALDTMDELTHGWGRALAVAYGLYWLLGLGALAGALAMPPGAGTGIGLALSLTFTLLPLAMSTDPAAVSSSCDDLLAELNAKRGELIGQPEAVANLRDLEDYLNTLNGRQG